MRVRPPRRGMKTLAIEPAARPSAGSGRPSHVANWCSSKRRQIFRKMRQYQVGSLLKQIAAARISVLDSRGALARVQTGHDHASHTLLSAFQNGVRRVRSYASAASLIASAWVG